MVFLSEQISKKNFIIFLKNIKKNQQNMMTKLLFSYTLLEILIKKKIFEKKIDTIGVHQKKVGLLTRKLTR